MVFNLTLREKFALIKIHFDMTDQQMADLLNVPRGTLWYLVNEAGSSNPKVIELNKLMEDASQHWNDVDYLKNKLQQGVK